MFFVRKEKKILNPANGECVSLSDIPDEVFSKKILGDGACVVPESDYIYSPVSGTIKQIFDTGHAYSILSDDGLEILVHIGLDTVKLNGKGFKSHVSEGDIVKAGDMIAEADVKYISEQGFLLYTPVIITNMDCIDYIKINETADKAKDVLFYYRKK